MAVRNTTATQFSAKIERIIPGKIANKSGSWVKPNPILKDSADMVIFLWEKPHFPIICRPLITIVPNIIIVHPPRTALGSVASTAPTTGKIPARIIIMAPVAITKRFTTLVMATRPTFWLKDVIGIQPNTEDNALTNPSQASEPAVSFWVTSRFKPDDASAEVSPIVSVADTKNIKTNAIMASA